MEFRKSLQEKLGEHEPEEVDQLILDDLFENMNQLTDDQRKSLELYNGLVHISFNGLGLRTLKNFPKLPNIEVLELRQNHLDGSELSLLKSLYPNLEKLKVGDNPIKSLDAFKALTGLNIRKLELEGTPVAQQNKNYRQALFQMLPKLEAVDRLTKEGDEVDSTIMDDEDDEFGGEDDGEFDDDEFDDDEEDFDEDGDDDEDEDEDEDDDAAGRKKPRKH